MKCKYCGEEIKSELMQSFLVEGNFCSKECIDQMEELERNDE